MINNLFLNNLKKSILKIICFLAISSIIGFLLVLLSYTFPTDTVRENISNSYNNLYGAYTEREKIFLDKGSDRVMCYISAFNNDDSLPLKAIENKLNSYFTLTDETKDWLESIKTTTKDNVEGYSYGRYWHGYLLFLKPLLSIFEVTDVYLINSIFIYLLTGITLFLLYKKCKTLLIPYILTIIGLSIDIIAICFQYSLTMSVALLSTIIVLLFYDKLKLRKIEYFLLLGIITNYFDLMTTYQLPLIFSAIIFIYKDYICEENLEFSKKKVFKDTIHIFFSFMSGYYGMWFIKLSLLFVFSSNSRIELMNVITARLGNSVDLNNKISITQLSHILIDILEINKNLLFVLLITLFLFLFAFILHCLKTDKSEREKFELNVCNILLIAYVLIIFIYFIVLYEHFTHHIAFMYKTLIPIIYLVNLESILILKNYYLRK